MDITHAFVSEIADDSDASLVRPSDWNEGHVFTTTGAFIVGWDGGGVALKSNKAVDVPIVYTGTITGWTLYPDVSGSAVVDIATDTYAGYPTFTSIVASAPPTLTSAAKATSSTLTGWTIAATAGDILRFTLSSASDVTRLLCVISYTRP